MNRRKSLRFFSALICLVAACGKVVVDPIDGVNGESGSTGGSGGATVTTGGAGGESIGSGAMCNEPPPPSPTVPDQPGCYFNNMGSGWVPVPCDCDLWLANTTQAPITARIQLLVTPPEQAPTLDGAFAVEIAFDDPDASWYAMWSKQTGNGAAFTVTHEGGTTTVRLGQNDVTLATVSLAACTTRKAIAHVLGGTSPLLSMQAVLGDGIAATTTNGTCVNPPPP